MPTARVKKRYCRWYILMAGADGGLSCSTLQSVVLQVQDEVICRQHSASVGQDNKTQRLIDAIDLNRHTIDR